MADCITTIHSLVSEEVEHGEEEGSLPPLAMFEEWTVELMERIDRIINWRQYR